MSTVPEVLDEQATAGEIVLNPADARPRLLVDDVHSTFGHYHVETVAPFAVGHRGRTGGHHAGAVGRDHRAEVDEVEIGDPGLSQSPVERRQLGGGCTHSTADVDDPRPGRRVDAQRLRTDVDAHGLAPVSPAGTAAAVEAGSDRSTTSRCRRLRRSISRMPWISSA